MQFPAHPIGAPIPVLFYLDQKYVGDCELRPGYGGFRWTDRPQSHHYFDPDSGKIWASVEVLGTEWFAWRLPSPDSKATHYKSMRRGLNLDWLFGTGFYSDWRNLLVLPEPILQLEFRAALYNLENNCEV